MKPTKQSIQPRHVGQVWEAPRAVQPCLHSVTRSICAAGYRGRCESAEWVLDYSFTPFGRCRVGSKSKTWDPRAAREVHLYSPRTPYWEDLGAAGVAQTRGIFLSFSGGEAAGLPALIGGKRYARFRDPEGRLGGLLERLLEIGLSAGQSGFWTAQGAFCEILSVLMAAAPGEDGIRAISQGAAASAPPDLRQKVRLYLREHLGERIRREDLAAHLHMSLSALAHRYQAEAGEAPMNTLARMRIQVAQSLLLKGYRLKSIAAQTGFCDEFHLSKTFRRLEGVSPRDYCRRRAPGITVGQQ